MSCCQMQDTEIMPLMQQINSARTMEDLVYCFHQNVVFFVACTFLLESNRKTCSSMSLPLYVQHIHKHLLFAFACKFRFPDLTGFARSGFGLC
ncbi:hypothetical protein CDAR_434991 [Caerostris darwini]|uniref:Uncharacterized protein n=1 Tax=Caerostris darwini TaxID=1538125 RepID=A0AAV4QH75_9ARAC|nr:hypothetical protein CDAR_434991 [Caerostris darwini]